MMVEISGWERKKGYFFLKLNIPIELTEMP